jgi:hypothetical protein
MKHQIKNEGRQLQYNDCVKLAFHQVLKQAKQMLATIERDELRCTLERSESHNHLKQGIIHEFINPLIYLRLECHSDDLYAIHFGIEDVNKPGQFAFITAAFLRLLYKVTMTGTYPIDIEQCVKTDWFLRNSCSEIYGYIEEHNQVHTFSRIKYKLPIAKRKELLCVA